VQEDSRLFAAYGPDLVVGDFRLSLDVSARLAGIPYATVTNAYWSPYARIEYPVPELPITRLFGVRAGQLIFDLFRPAVSRLHAKPMNALRKRHGLSPLEPDTRVIYTHADYTLYADLPELVPMAPLPANHAFIGPVVWSPQVALPNWWAGLPDDLPMAYVTLGSSGDANAIPAVLDGLAALGYGAMVATTGRVKLEPRSSVWIADYLPGLEAARRASLVVCNGGSPTCYQALCAGIPILGIPSNLDQYLNMSAIQQAGVGVQLRRGRLSAKACILQLRKIRDNSGYARRAQNLRERIAGQITGRHFEGALSRALNGTPPGSRQSATPHGLFLAS
jgi:UDP:flavonoid glycosyltransferase YjiC (YdhE family)